MLALNNTKKKIASIIIMMILFLNILGIKSFALVEPTYDFYVNDYANLLSTDEEAAHLVAEDLREVFRRNFRNIILGT